MERLRLVVALHAHQPVGNLRSVIEAACERCYEPVFAALGRHPGVKIGLHVSGCLLEWLEDERPALFDRIAELAGDGQVELLGGGMFEPILAALPEADADAQVELMGAWLEDRFGAQPRGAWLAERVWDQALAGLLSRQGLEYTLVDAHAFERAGLARAEVHGHWVTDQAGDALCVFPIDGALRLAIPNEPVERIMQGLEALAEDPLTTCVTFADDLEKFGMWPGSSEVVGEAGWLEAFLTALEQASDWLTVCGPAAALDAGRPRGQIFLPQAAYPELERWALPQPDRIAEQAVPGAPPWQAFLAKYPEANRLYRKMLLVSRKLSEALEDDEPWEEDHEDGRYALFRGQCHDAYWHGLFGGLYLPHLRQAAYQQLLLAESILDLRSQGDDWIATDQLDLDGDLADEILLEHNLLNAIIDPNRGGVLLELDHRPSGLNLTDVMTRRVEPSESRDGADEDDLQGQGVHDAHPRHCLMDRFPAMDTALEQLQQASYAEEGDFLGAVYQVESVGIDEEGDYDFELVMRRTGRLLRDTVELPLTIEKRVHIPSDAAALQVTYGLTNPTDAAIDLLFCPELNLNLPASGQARQRIEYQGLIGAGAPVRGAGEIEETAWIALIDDSARLRIDLQFEPPAPAWRYPVETVSRSESGLEINHQGTAVVPRWELTVPAGSTCQLTIRLAVDGADVQAPADLAASAPEDSAPEAPVERKPAESDAVVPVESDAVVPVESDAVVPVESDAVVPVEADAVVPVETDAVIPVESEAVVTAEPDTGVGVDDPDPED